MRSSAAPMTVATWDHELPPLPTAPTQEVWDRMTPAQRLAMEAELPVSFPFEYGMMSEGDPHLDARMEARETLRRWFRTQAHPWYVGADMMVFYPGEQPIAPDVFLVRDAEDRERTSWLVSKEAKGLTWALEILASGQRAKDLRRNVMRFARLGIEEYFVLDLRHRRIHGWRQSAPGVRTYEPIAARSGTLPSSVLGLDLALVGRRLRFRLGSAELLAPSDVQHQLEDAIAELSVTAEQEAARAEQEAARADQERQRREDAEREVATLRAELARLRGG